jgi:RNA polymerase sigma-70 factor (ECF subfamily)
MAEQPISDIERVRRMLAGDEAAFEQFFADAYPALYRFALVRLAFDRDAAAEVAQATVCKAIGKLHTFRGEAALLTWLCAFCRHELYAWTKRHGRVQVELLEDDPEIRAALESLRASDDIESALDRASLASLVQRVLDHLPVHYASALELKYIDDISVQEIGVRLGLGAKAAESLLSRARAAFREGFRTLTPAGSGLES